MEKKEIMDTFHNLRLLRVKDFSHVAGKEGFEIIWESSDSIIISGKSETRLRFPKTKTKEPVQNLKTGRTNKAVVWETTFVQEEKSPSRWFSGERIGLESAPPKVGRRSKLSIKLYLYITK